ncbi:DUF2157 domain-containing protein [Aquibacillus rhizosphaerae]|uniref:DUF2157 domain-containing protein n=1 Tax=Aquibacillus rhizosphaerae TaxID=3051431 RepID=A0ABT7LAJ8_9BACI|nr:DUF2157 domain-containing protein [Aquibacillus sp. LR5S19]MDL4842873.1 DUF2157 domain-containing protein [Aquibacillus sp. LR5S19]
MNRDSLKKESLKWLNEGIITEEQQKQILNRYPAKKRTSLLLTFASLFIGLGFLTLIASNWSLIPQLGKMSVILVFMLAFYLTGDWVYRNKSARVGLSFITIGLFIFGAGIFLTGQMYNYMYFQAIPFLIWAIAAIALFILYQHPSLFVIAMTITTVGQLYSAWVYGSFYIVLFVIFVLAFGHYTYHQARGLYGYLFSVSFVIHVLVLTFSTGQGYYWLLIYFLVLYVIGDVVGKQDIRLPFKSVSVISVFLLSIIEVFLLSNSYFYENIDKSVSFMFIWLSIFVITIVLKIVKKQSWQLIDLVLFLPVFYVTFGDMFSMLCLFAFSLGLLLLGYKEEDHARVTNGTITFLISTLIAYVHLAWAFLDKSLFFFVGGALLFVLSYFLEKKRRTVKNEVQGGDGK